MSADSPHWKYTPGTRMGYLRITQNEVAKTVEADRANIDLDRQGRIVGIELFL